MKMGGLATHLKAIFFLLLLLMFHGINNWMFLKADNLYFVSDLGGLYLNTLSLVESWQGNHKMRGQLVEGGG